MTNGKKRPQIIVFFLERICKRVCSNIWKLIRLSPEVLVVVNLFLDQTKLLWNLKPFLTVLELSIQFIHNNWLVKLVSKSSNVSENVQTCLNKSKLVSRWVRFKLNSDEWKKNWPRVIAVLSSSLDQPSNYCLWAELQTTKKITGSLKPMIQGRLIQGLMNVWNSGWASRNVAGISCPSWLW